MKKLLSGLLILIWAFVLPTVKAGDPAGGSCTIRVLTFNIRTSNGEVGKPEEWKNRRQGVVELIKCGDYDFVGVQEAILNPKKENLSHVDHLKSDLPGYGMIYRPRGKSEDHGEGTPLLYNKSRWVLDETEHGVIWLSATPDEPGSKAKDPFFREPFAGDGLFVWKTGRQPTRRFTFSTLIWISAFRESWKARSF